MSVYIPFTLLLLIIIYLSFRLLRKRLSKRNLTLVLILLMVGLPIVFYLLLNFYSLQYEKKFTTFEVLIDALEKYRSEVGYYPRTLNDLIPKYISKIPSIPDVDHLSRIEFADTWSGETKAFYGKPFIGENRPPFLLGFWGSGGVLGNDTVIRYCPKEKDCRYRIRVTGRSAREFTEEVRLPERVNDFWVQTR